MMPRIYIRDQNDEVLDTLDEGQYFDDNMQRFLKGKATVLSFTIVKNETSYALMTASRNLSFRFDEEDFWLSCVIVEQDETYLTVTAWSLGLELNNETHGPYKAPKAMTFAEYLAVIDIERILTIGINEVADKKISHEWEGTESKLARLYSLATVFGTELAFDTELNEDGSLKQITLNVYREHTDTDQGLGQDRRNETFYFGEDIKTIRKAEDKSNLYTAIAASGKDGLTIGGIEREVFDEDGNLLFATYKTQKPGFADPRKLYAVQAREQFPSNTTGGDHWTLHTAGEFEYTTTEALYGYMLSELKKHCQPETTWEIEGYIKAKIGDTVRIADEGYKPTLYLEARVIEQEISFTDQTKNKSTFSNVVELESQVDSNLLDQVQKLIEANKTYQYSISTDNGIVFKNNTGTTTLSATVWDGVADVTSEFEIAWLKDGTAVGAGADLTVSASDVASKAVYRFNASRGGVVVGGYEVTVSDVSDGEAGISPIVTPNDNGTITIVDKEGEKTTPDLTGPQGPPTGIISQNTVPSSPYVGMLWQCTGNIAGYINPATYRWNGSAWEIYQFTAQNILAETFTGFVFQGVDFIGSRFINDYTVVDAITGVTSTGRLNISGGSYLNQYSNSDGTGGMFTIDQRGRLFNSRNTYGIDESYELLPGGLYMHSGDFAGALTANMLTYTPWTEISLRSGFQTAENNPPSYRVQYNVDGTRTVKFRGQVTTTNAPLPNAYFTKNIDYYWGQMPADLLPEKNSFFWGCTGATNLFGGRLVLSLAHEGQLIFNSPHANVNYVVLDGWEYTLD